MRGTGAEGRPDSPLGKTLGFIDPERYYFGLKLGPSGGSYETARSLTQDGGQALAEQMELAQTKWDLGARDAALFMLGTYAWRVGGPAIACYVLHRRVPDISPGNVALGFDGDGGVSEVALLHGGFGVLPEDPAAGHPEAVVLDGEAALLGWMRARLVAGVEPLIGAVREHVRVGQRAAWRWVVDYIASAFLMVAWDTEDQARYAADARAFLAAPDSPLNGNASFFVVQSGDRRGAYATRGVCCQAYKDPEHDHCNTCPMLAQEERERRAVVDLATRG